MANLATKTKISKKTNILKVSVRLKQLLMGAGTLETYPAKQRLFRVDQETAGVYLVVKGKVRLSMPELPRLDRTFTPGSLLGLPATFTGNAYSLEATSATDSEVLHVERKAFLELMANQPEFCREAADILSREVSFIQGALAERRRARFTAA